MTAYLKISSSVFTASVLGWAILLFLVPERLGPSDPPLSPLERILYFTGVGLALPTLPLTVLIDRLQPPLPGWVSILANCLISALLGSFLILAAYRVWNRKHTEPGAPPNGGPAASLSNSGVTEGPPSVS